MVGKIFITRQGYDPQLGKHVKDPYLGPNPTLGACRPDVRKQLTKGDHIFVISGKVPGAPQYVMAGFEIAAKIDGLTPTSSYRSTGCICSQMASSTGISSVVPTGGSMSSTTTTRSRTG
jgi:hypothetical protein